MPGPKHSSRDDRGAGPRWPAAETPPAGSTDHELALSLPDWDLLPPAEFLDRRASRRERP